MEGHEAEDDDKDAAAGTAAAAQASEHGEDEEPRPSTPGGSEADGSAQPMLPAVQDLPDLEVEALTKHCAHGRGRAAGVDAASHLLYMALLRAPATACYVADLCSRVTRNELPANYARAVTAGRAAYLVRPGGGLRLIVVPTVLRRLAAAALESRYNREAGKQMAGTQYAVGLKAAQESFFHDVTTHMGMRPDVPLVALSVDVSNAFSTLGPPAMHLQLPTSFLSLLGPYPL